MGEVRSSSGFAWSSAGLTDKGCVRPLNEDAFLCDPERGVWAVADGMGGHDAGDFASQVVIDGLKDVRPSHRAGIFVQEIKTRMERANARLLAEAAARSSPVIGATVVILVRVGSFGAVLWAGDSRAYLLRAGNLSQLSIDHSEVQAMIDRGLLEQKDAERHPASAVVSRAIGGSPVLALDVLLTRVGAGDRLLLCSDGVSKALTQAQLSASLVPVRPDQAARGLIDACLARGAADNVTAVVVDVPSGKPSV
jgi:protein phosphatase